MLAVNNLNCGYGSRPEMAVLKNITFPLKAGEILTLIGPNGAGKTTLLKTVFGLLPQLSGQILWTDKSDIQKSSMLESHPYSAFSHPVQDLFEMPGIRNSKLVQWTLQSFELQDLLCKDILSLSAGQAKRVWLAHTLCLNRQLTIIDEPFLHLDWKHKKRLAQILGEFKNRFHGSFILASHELELAASVSNRFLLISNESLLLDNTPTEVLTSKMAAEVFAFTVNLDNNPIDGSLRITLG